MQVHMIVSHTRLLKDATPKDTDTVADIEVKRQLWDKWSRTLTIDASTVPRSGDVVYDIFDNGVSYLVATVSWDYRTTPIVRVLLADIKVELK